MELSVNHKTAVKSQYRLTVDMEMSIFLKGHINYVNDNPHLHINNWLYGGTFCHKVYRVEKLQHFLCTNVNEDKLIFICLSLHLK